MGFRAKLIGPRFVAMPSVLISLPEMLMNIANYSLVQRLAFATTVALLLAWGGSASAADSAQRQAEVDAVKADLAVLPKFKKFYDHLKAHPESIATNGPILAGILWEEVNENKTIREHAPSMTATLQEVERLATAGHATKLAMQAIDAQLAHDAELMPESLALQKKSSLIAYAARAAGEPGAKPQDRAETLALVEQLLTSAIDSGNETVVSEMLAAQLVLAKTSTERTNAAIALLVTTDEQLQAEKANIAARLMEHLGELLKYIPASKERKEVSDALDALKSRVALASAADAARQTLAKEPTNAAANQAIGMHLLVNQGDWGQAILYLALGTDETWKSLATDTIALPKDAKSKAALAERWAALDNDPHAESKQVARDLYTQALADPTFVGFSRAAAEEKLKALGPAKERKIVAKPEMKKPEPTKPPRMSGQPPVLGPAVVTATNRKQVVIEDNENFPAELRGRFTKYDVVVPPKPGEADVKKGAIEFTVDETGVLYLIGSWGYQGNNGGGWTGERLMPEGLIERGWEKVGKLASDEKSGIFRKVVTKGETYRIRVNKYGPPTLFTLLPPESK